MYLMKGAFHTPIACTVVLALSAAFVTPADARFGAQAQQQPAAQTPAARQVVGTIKDIRGNSVTLAPDTGAEVNVLIQASVRIVRVPPGQTDLRNAAPIQLSELQVGDRVLVRGTPGGDASSITATSVIAMKRSELEARQEQERQDWQRRGIGGLVTAVDAGTGTITISVAAPGGTRAVALRAASDTIVRRYAPDSVRFDEARPSALAQIKAGDQLRSRGARSADGNEFAAEEIVAGSFRNIAGMIDAVDAAANTLTVMDLATKRPVLVRVTTQSKVTKLTPEAAQGIAARANAARAAGPTAAGGSAESGRRGGGRGAGGGASNARPGGGQGDLQQVVSRMPAAKLADLQKGEAVMIVSTEGTESAGVTAIVLVGGVEPILTASPGGSEQMTLSPWNLGGGDGGDDAP
jgi:hypothetical protein